MLISLSIYLPESIIDLIAGTLKNQLNIKNVNTYENFSFWKDIL